MRRWNRSNEIEGSADERGSASLEFVLVGLLLLVPLVYLVIALGAIQGQALGTESGARHVARTIATAEGPDDARARAQRVLSAVAREYGLDEESVRLAIQCRPASATCPTAGATVVVTVSTRAVLPLVPGVLGLDRVASVPVEATAVQRASRTWGTGG